MTKDLVFTKDKFSYEEIQTKKFRNYLKIVTPEIVNMPDVGFDPEVIGEIDYAKSQNQSRSESGRSKFIRDSIVRGALQYEIVVNGYTETLLEDGTFKIEEVKLS